MLQTIEVEIDSSGHIHPLEPLAFIPSGRAYLTLLPVTKKEFRTLTAGDGSAAKALELLASPRFAQRPAALLTKCSSVLVSFAMTGMIVNAACLS